MDMPVPRRPPGGCAVVIKGMSLKGWERLGTLSLEAVVGSEGWA